MNLHGLQMLMTFLFRFCGCQIGDSNIHKQLILIMFSQEYNIYIFTMTAKCCTKQELKCLANCNTKYKFYGDKQTKWYNLLKTKTIKTNKMCEDFLHFHIIFFFWFFFIMVNLTGKKLIVKILALQKMNSYDDR